MSLKTKILLNGIDITQYVVNPGCSLEINDTIRKEDKGNCSFNTAILDVTTVSNNDSFVFYRGETTANIKRWTGYVANVSNQTGTIEVTVKGNLTRIDRREIQKTYDIDVDPEAGVISAIAEDIMENGDVTATVVDSGTVNVFKVFPCRREPRSRKLRELEDTLRWACLYDHANSEGLFQPRGYTSAGVTLTVGAYPVINAPIWDENDDVLYNQFTVEGLEVQVGRTDWFSGDASTTEFELAEFPVSINSVWSGDANFQTTRPDADDLVVGGAEDVTADIDYHWREESKIITFESGSIPTDNTNNVQVDFNYNEALPGFFLNETSQDNYGIREKTVTVLYLNNADDVDALGASLLSEYKDIKLSTRLLVGNDLTEFPESALLYPNKTVQVVDNVSPKPVEKTLTIRKLILRYPEPYDEVDVGEHVLSIDDFLERTLDRIKKIEDRFKSQGGLRQYRTFELNVEYPAQCDVYTGSPVADTMYWSDPARAEWGTAKWGDGTAETVTLARRVHHPLGFMYFDIYDQDLVAAATTATVTSATGVIAFDSGEFFKTEILFLNNETYTTITLDLKDSVLVNQGDMTFEACGDGDDETWETITPGTAHTFTVADTKGVKLRISYAGSGGSITLEDSDNNAPLPWKITVT